MLLRVLLVFCQISWSCAGLAAGLLQGQVVSVHDGDTLTLQAEDQRVLHIRLAEIDAPELRQPWGQLSKQSLAELVAGRLVRVEWQSTDRYGRIVGRVYAGLVDVCAEQVRRGLAWAYPKYVLDPVLYQLEREARAGRRGLWVDPAPVPPWEWRHSSH